MIVGVVGYKRSGKNTLANYLIKKNFQMYALADPIKDVICEIFLWNKKDMEKPENKERIDPRWGISYRQACQHLGTEWGQYGLTYNYPYFQERTGRNLWIRRFIFWRQNILSQGIKNFVIPDIRFPHEQDVLKSIDDVVIFVRVTRDDALMNRDDHESERYALTLPCDYEIENNGTIEEFDNKIKSWYNSLI